MKILKIIYALVLFGLIAILVLEFWPRTSKGGLGSYVPTLRLAIENYRKEKRKWPENIEDLRIDETLSNRIASNFESFTMRRDLQFQSDNYERFKVSAVERGYFWTTRIFEREILVKKTYN